MRRTHLRGRDNIRKRIPIHASAFNLSLVLRGLFEVGTPRGFQGRKSLVISDICAWIDRLMACFTQRWVDFGQQKSVRAEKYFSGHRQMPLAA
jgi:transposase